MADRTCANCGSDRLGFLGVLGRRMWFRCMHCHAQLSEPAPDDAPDDPATEDDLLR